MDTRHCKPVYLTLLIISLIGLGASILSFHMYNHVSSGGNGSFCSLGGGGCPFLYSVPEAELLGIHFSVLAPVYFSLILVLTVSSIARSNSVSYKGLATIYLAGLPFIPYLIYVEHKYHTLCVYCTIMHIAILTGAVISLSVLKMMNAG